LAESHRSSHSDAIAGVRVKRFLTLAVMRLANELINQSDTLETRKNIELIILDLVKTNFSLTSSANPLSQAKLFIASLGFSPCEIEWAEDVRLGKVMLGKGRLWKASTAKEMELVKLLLTTIIKGIGYSFLSSNVQVKFVENAVLPPRFSYEIQFRAAEDVFAESIHTTKEKAEVLLSAGSLLRPILGSGIRIEDATRFLIDATREVAGMYKSELLLRKDISDYPLKLIEVFYLKMQEDEKLLSLAYKIGELMAKDIKREFPDLKNHQILKGIGLLPTEEIDELLFYGSSEICGEDNKGSNISFCKFLGSIWSGFASEVLGKKFEMSEEPLCATGTGTKCIFTLDEIKT
jgi:hypothetical protein